MLLGLLPYRQEANIEGQQIIIKTRPRNFVSRAERYSAGGGGGGGETGAGAGGEVTGESARGEGGKQGQAGAF